MKKYKVFKPEEYSSESYHLHDIDEAVKLTEVLNKFDAGKWAWTDLEAEEEW